MSEENVDAIRQGFEALASDGVDGLLALIDPEFEFTTPPGLALEPQTYRGHAGVRRYFDSFYDAMDEVRFDADEFIDAGDHVIVPFRLVARGRETGIEVAQPAVQVWEVHGGRAVSVELYPTLEAARASVSERG